MTQNDILKILIKVHQRLSKSKTSSGSSQMCTMWSITNPPDILENTAPLNAIEKELDWGFYEIEAVEFYDMDIDNAAKYIYSIISKGE